MMKKRTVRPKILVRAVVALSMMFVWSLVLITGLLMWLAPHGQAAGREPFILGLTRHDIGEYHLVVALVAVSLTIAHVIIDWKAFLSLMRYLADTARNDMKMAK
ncbi:MAG: DUF4405 domain-containing protein [Balneolaceae bacterium]